MQQQLLPPPPTPLEQIKLKKWELQKKQGGGGHEEVEVQEVGP